MPLIAGVEVKNHAFEDEARDYKAMNDLAFARGLLYLKFIYDKGLLKDFEEWRRKQVLEVL